MKQISSDENSPTELINIEIQYIIQVLALTTQSHAWVMALTN